MKRENTEITKQVINAQKRNPLKGDFVPQVNKNLVDLSISENDLLLRSEEDLKSLLKNKLRAVAFQELIEKAREHSKVNENIYKDMNGCAYLSDKRFTPDIVNLLFSFQTRCFDMKNNFRNKY